MSLNLKFFSWFLFRNHIPTRVHSFNFSFWRTWMQLKITNLLGSYGSGSNFATSKHLRFRTRSHLWLSAMYGVFGIVMPCGNSQRPSIHRTSFHTYNNIATCLRSPEDNRSQTRFQLNKETVLQILICSTYGLIYFVVCFYRILFYLIRSFG
jgi:hypothetical protein